jgi:hypothetical protein
MEPLPVVSFFFDGLIPEDEMPVGISAIRESDNLPYDINSDESAGKYFITPQFFNNNYILSVETATLYVNPYGPGTRAIIPKLNCIQELPAGSVMGFIANFEYSNENEEDFYIPAGADNLLTGNFELIDPQPVLFKSGGGTFSLYFDGEILKWSVNSLDEDHKVSMASNANSSSTKCQSVLKSGKTSSATDTDNGLLMLPGIVAYPNPVDDRVKISMKDIETFDVILVYDYSGKTYSPVPEILSPDLIELDMSSLPNGTYFIRVIMNNDSRVITVIKQ